MSARPRRTILRLPFGSGVNKADPPVLKSIDSPEARFVTRSVDLPVTSMRPSGNVLLDMLLATVSSRVGNAHTSPAPNSKGSLTTGSLTGFCATALGAKSAPASRTKARVPRRNFTSTPLSATVKAQLRTDRNKGTRRASWRDRLLGCAPRSANSREVVFSGGSRSSVGRSAAQGCGELLPLLFFPAMELLLEERLHRAGG